MLVVKLLLYFSYSYYHLKSHWLGGDFTNVVKESFADCWNDALLRAIFPT